jgi:hypothetical protein
MNADTLRALADNGFAVDSSINACYDFPYPRDEPARLFHCSRMGGIAEFPVTIFRDGFGRLRPLQIAACSASEMAQALNSARDFGVSDATLFSHNFELISRGQTREDRIASRRFDTFCGWLARHADEYPTLGFDATAVPDAPPPWSWPSASAVATATRHVAQLARRANDWVEAH